MPFGNVSLFLWSTDLPTLQDNCSISCSFHLLYSQLMTSLLISFKLKKKLKRMFSSFHYHYSSPSYYLEWTELPMSLSEVKPSTVC